MQDRLQVPPRLRVGEYQVAERAAVEFAFGGEDRLAEARDDLAERGLAGGDDRARDLVRVDDGDAEFREACGNRASCRWRCRP